MRGKKCGHVDEKAGRTEVCDLVGILSDVPSNKKYGVKMLYAPIKLKGKTIWSVLCPLQGWDNL